MGAQPVSLSVSHVAGFNEQYEARILTGPPLIMPSRHFVFPRAVAGEEDAMARGALWIEVMPNGGANFLAQCALGFAGSAVATAVWATPHPDHLLAVAGGYAYRIDTNDPERTEFLPMRPVVEILPSEEARALVLLGFHHALVLTADDVWQSPKLTWEGVTEVQVEGELVHGKGWHMPTDQERPFSLNLRTRELTGGGFAL